MMHLAPDALKINDALTKIFDALTKIIDALIKINDALMKIFDALTTLYIRIKYKKIKKLINSKKAASPPPCSWREKYFEGVSIYVTRKEKRKTRGNGIH